MGVQGLWNLIEPVGKPIPLESLENKVLAVDVSIWLHQATKGFRDANGQPLPNAHLLGLFHRVCKLLFYRIKPVFVFDGGVPPLKKQTLAARRIRKEAASMRANKASEKLIASLVQSELLGRGGEKLQLLNRRQTREKDLFELPSTSQGSLLEEAEEQAVTETFLSDSESDVESEYQLGGEFNIHSVDVDSAEFRSLPPNVQHEILTDLRETRKENSWGKMNQMPKEALNFSSFQLQRLLRRRKVQERLEEVGKEVQAASRRRFEEENEGYSIETSRMASDATKEYVLMKRLPRHNDFPANEPLPKKPKLEEVDEAEEEISQDAILRMIQSDAGLSSESSNDDEFEEVPERVSPVVSVPVEGKSGVITVKVNLSDNFDDGDDIFADIFHKEDTGQEKEAKDGVVADVSSHKESLKAPAGDSQGTESYDGGHSTELRVLKRVTPPIGSLFGNSDVEKVDITEEARILKEMEMKIEKKIEAVAGRSSSIKKSCEEALKNNSDRVKVQRGIENEIVAKPSVTKMETYVNSEEIATGGRLMSLPGIVPLLATESKPSLNLEAFLSNTGGSDRIKDFIRVDKGDSDFIEKSIVESFTHLRSSADDEVGIMSEESDLKTDKEDLADESGSSKQISELKDGVLDTKDLVANGKDGRDQFAPPPRTADDLTENFAVSVLPPETPESIVEERQALVTEEVKELKERGEAGIESSSFDKSLSCAMPISLDKTANLLSPRLEPIKAPVSSSPPHAKVEYPLEVSPKKTPQKILEEAIESRSFWKFSEEMKNVRRDEHQEALETDSDEFEEVPSAEPMILTEKEKDQVQAALEMERREIIKEKGRQERLATTITDQMYAEAQDLLRLFGVPYIVAPMEAEAQCAFLDIHQLTQGTITDDSDIWLFGGKRVYKNFFNQTKYVEFFNKDDIEKVFRLGRDELIALALLTGSDYTEGIESVGPVTALEILAEFPGRGLDSLKAFKSWLQTRSDFSENRIRKKLKGIKLTPGFPSEIVVMAYIQPEVDESTERFTWGEPDEKALRDFGRTKFGWTNEKLDELLGPTLARWRSKQSQTRIDSYFSVTFDREVKMSKRVLEALNRGAAWEHDESDVYLPRSEGKKPAARKQRRKRGVDATLSEENVGEVTEEPIAASVPEQEVTNGTTSEHFSVEAINDVSQGSQAQIRKSKEPTASLRKVEDPNSLRARLGKALLKSNPGFKARLIAEKTRKQRLRAESQTAVEQPPAAPAAQTRNNRTPAERQGTSERPRTRLPRAMPASVEPSTSGYVPIVPPRPERVPEPVPVQPDVIPQRQRDLEEMEMRKKKAAELLKGKKA